LTKFLRGPDGAVYLMDAGRKRHILSPAALASNGGSSSNIIDASTYSLDRFATGATIG
jgi:hypothetical protein